MQDFKSAATVAVGALCFALVALAFAGTMAALGQGIILAFSASLLLGIICLFFQVPFILFGLAYWFTGVDLPSRIVEALPQIFG